MFAFVFNHVVAIAKKKQQTFLSSYSIHSFDNVNKQNSFGKTNPTQTKTKGFFNNNYLLTSFSIFNESFFSQFYFSLI